MAHFAKVENNIVTQVIVAEQEFIDSGAVGDPSQWIQTSYNGNIRNTYAGIGYIYNADLDAFIAPQPFSSWVLNESTAAWEAPIARPADDKNYIWDEDTQSWIEAPSVLPGV